MESSHKNNLSLKYKSYCNLISTLLKDSKQWYFTYFFKSNNNDIKKGIKSITSMKSKSNNDSPRSIIHEGSFIADPLSIDNVFNDFFSKIVQKVQSKTKFSSFFFFFFPDFLPPNIHDSIILSQIAEDETSKIISSLNSSKSIGPNSISTKTLKLLQGQTSKHFITTGVFPNSLKSAKVIPIH